MYLTCATVRGSRETSGGSSSASYIRGTALITTGRAAEKAYKPYMRAEKQVLVRDRDILRRQAFVLAAVSHSPQHRTTRYLLERNAKLRHHRSFTIWGGIED